MVKGTTNIFHRIKNIVRRCCVGGDMIILLFGPFQKYGGFSKKWKKGWIYNIIKVNIFQPFHKIAIPTATPSIFLCILVKFGKNVSSSSSLSIFLPAVLTAYVSLSVQVFFLAYFCQFFGLFLSD